VTFSASTPDRIRTNVYAATDRRDEGTANAPSFGVKRDIERVNFARARVELPRSEPLTTDIERTVVIEKIDKFADGPAFAAAVKEVLTISNTTRILIHIHGYYNKFAYALRRTAALERELAFPGVVVLYSWPSLGEAPAYGYDNDSILVTAQNFDKFVTLLETVVDRSKISILVHSMGSRVWVDYIQQRAGPVRKYDHVVLAAADLSRDLFNARHADISSFATKVSVYAAESDRTLGVSETVSSGERLGKPPSGGIFVSPPIETIDATRVAELNGWWHHSYVFETRRGSETAAESLRNRPRCPAGGIAWRERCPER
jgi:esterase/lipase superfamily enzyme